MSVSLNKQDKNQNNLSDCNVGNNPEPEQMQEDQPGDSCGSRQRLITAWSIVVSGDEEKWTGLEDV